MNDQRSRRVFLSTLGGTIVAATWKPAAAQSAVGPFVLVHGAWHGGWCWRKVAGILGARGHDVFTPTLTGLGDRRHLANADVALSTHVEDVIMMLEAEDLRDVVLVGHSYAGLVLGGVIQRQRDRLRQVIFLDAFLPEPGRSLQDSVPGLRFEEIAKASGDGWRVPMSSVFTLDDLGIHNAADKQWMEPRISDQPVRTFTEPSSIAPETLASVPCSFILSSSIRRSCRRRIDQGSRVGRFAVSSTQVMMLW